MMGKRHFVMAAGGTGGHMVPAHALAEELMARGHQVSLITDERGAKIPALFGNVEVNILPAGRLAGGVLGWLKAGRNILAGRAQARRFYREVRPAAVVGFGGYPALPALLAAQGAGIATIIHEQNAVLGRVNRLLARKVNAIATAYPQVDRLPKASAKKVELVGNPVRDEVLSLRDRPFPKPEAEFNVLVTGGSQGATVLSSVVPDGLALLPEPYRNRLNIVQQCRAEDIDRVRARYAELGLKAELATYLADMPERLASAHLVIARAGASTIAELTAAGRPAILVPLPIATDDHQTANAREMAKEGGARMVPQSEFTPERLAQEIATLGLEPDALAEAAAHARACGRPDATRALADLVERISRTPGMDPLPAKEQPVAAPVQGALA
ncbi:undecaprenyldiphospho-muramoylpentapeptide beta-N-acetylglucosaminyltransferase [Allosphingosinicella flava]|uniref:UDP-N-acetylglucosamine--N-acetylmuramyl-(pentapeptide) pyrophosphoryl-undecaprenol N-acetylglucosamine transferase n=1 Tax=Allosphingosinicella flava TaxID=2771430 RepID=A0A7T2LL35_9SPHN|nr:undecaprenyldiphospho-muramoylpentapeptide beta-N-acetylglucosaminyltransferase [Sphingosinicella flava]QPQ54056.1 undecaprenyldiphospho-muramoylpentapeptide beta-N-acetylglucosaminyltransferase [Sphingosinicella flava]